MPCIGSGSVEVLKSLLVRFSVSVAASQSSFTVALMTKRGTETVIGISMSLHVDDVVEGRGDAVAAIARMEVSRGMRMMAIDTGKLANSYLGKGF